MPRNVDQWSREVRKYHSHMVPKLAPVMLSRPRNQKIYSVVVGGVGDEQAGV